MSCFKVKKKREKLSYFPNSLHKKWSFPLRIVSVNVIKSQETPDLVTFIEEILNGKLNFLHSEFFLKRITKIGVISTMGMKQTVRKIGEFEKLNFVKSESDYKRLLTLSWRRPLSCRNLSIDLLLKSMDWFLYDTGRRHERVKAHQDGKKVWIMREFEKSGIQKIEVKLWLEKIL